MAPRPSNPERTLLVTGGAGFIGSHFVQHILKNYPTWRVVVLDKLTYAGTRKNLEECRQKWPTRMMFHQGDVCLEKSLTPLFREHFDYVVHFAAETHVDRSIKTPGRFLRTDIFGTYALLEMVRQYGTRKFIMISTDEVYGPCLGESEDFRENDRMYPSSPYSASKAAAELLARSYWVTFGMPVIVTRAANTYGPRQ